MTDPADRYRFPDPLCSHKPTQRAHAGTHGETPHASTYVCDRETCIEDAKAWVRATTHLEPTLTRFPEDGLGR